MLRTWFFGANPPPPVSAPLLGDDKMEEEDEVPELEEEEEVEDKIPELEEEKEIMKKSDLAALCQANLEKHKAETEETLKSVDLAPYEKVFKKEFIKELNKFKEKNPMSMWNFSHVKFKCKLPKLEMDQEMFWIKVAKNVIEPYGYTVNSNVQFSDGEIEVWFY